MLRLEQIGSHNFGADTSLECFYLRVYYGERRKDTDQFAPIFSFSFRMGIDPEYAMWVIGAVAKKNFGLQAMES